MKTILAFSFLGYVVPVLILCAILCATIYYYRVRLKNRAQIKMMQENEKKKKIYADLITFWINPIFNPKDDLQNAIMNMVLLKQKIKAVELIASEEVKNILSEYNILDCETPTDLSRLESAMKKEF